MAPKSRGRKKSKRATPSRQAKKAISEQDIRDIEVQSAKQLEQHSFHLRYAPIPTAAELADYDRVDPSFSNRIVAMAEKQLRASNRNKFFENISIAILTFSGQLFALVALVGILYLIYLAIQENNETAIKWLPLSAAGIISVFIIGRTRRKRS